MTNLPQTTMANTLTPEQRFAKLLKIYGDGICQYYESLIGSPFSEERAERDTKKLFDFLASEIAKAKAEERDRIREELENKPINELWQTAIKKVLSKLEDKGEK